MECALYVCIILHSIFQSKLFTNLDRFFFFQVKMYIERIAEDTHSLLAVDGHIPACGDNKAAWRWQWHCDCDLLDWCVFYQLPKGQWSCFALLRDMFVVATQVSSWNSKTGTEDFAVHKGHQIVLQYPKYCNPIFGRFQGQKRQSPVRRPTAFPYFCSGNCMPRLRPQLLQRTRHILAHLSLLLLATSVGFRATFNL